MILTRLPMVIFVQKTHLIDGLVDLVNYNAKPAGRVVPRYEKTSEQLFRGKSRLVTVRRLIVPIPPIADGETVNDIADKGPCGDC
ncbi:hypothetical protein SAMN04487897_11628 [Paenibacillus sp. yr247]|nr:hypothetical protein SAMN04487897_11628 [Paenibacillus sp. yr247]